MFTEGLDASAINWIKQGSDVDQQARSPLAENVSLDPIPNAHLLYNSYNYLSPKVLPPLKFHSGLLGPLPSMVDLEDVESVASVSDDIYGTYSDTFEEEGLGSTDSDMFEKLISQSYDEEIKSSANLSHESVSGSNSMHRPTLVRRFSKENLRIEVTANVKCTNGEVGIRGISDRNSISGAILQNHERNGFLNSCELGTPSAPPMVGNGRESSLDAESKQWMASDGERRAGCMTEMEQTKLNRYQLDEAKVTFSSTEVSSDLGTQSRKSNQLPGSSISGEGEIHMSSCQTNVVNQMPCYNTSAQSAWQTFIAYDACFRLCLNAWARNSMEAPEFLRDECVLLRNAFGLQKFLLQPRGQIPGEGRPVDNTDGACTMKGRKVIGQIEVEVKKIRIIPLRRKLRATYSQRAMQVGAEYVRQVSTMLKTRINALKNISFPLAPEEALSCSLQLKSSTEDASIFLRPGIGDFHIFYPESQGDALLIEVQDINRVSQGRTIIRMSALTDNPGERVRWWEIYDDNQVCVGKIQLFISSSGSTSDKISSTKSGPVVETLVYDLVLEAAMRAQHFHQKNLHMHGTWKWLLDEFADYYGVSDAYTKLRYLSYIMNIATPTMDCLELVHELLSPIVKARGEKSLTRQERSIFLDCEDQIKKLLATAFENYKSLDDLSLTGLTDLFGPISESAAPALVPAVQIFTLLHDILSQEAQTIMRKYLQTAAAKRCRRHMVETDEFLSSNYDGFLTDPMTVSTAYLKMKTLCINISNEIQADIKIHNQHILPSSIDLPNIAASLYSTELCKRLRGFLAACPPSKPSPHVTELLIATADFERDLYSWKIIPVHGGVVSRDLFHNYILVWFQDTRLHLLELCKAEKVPCSAISSHGSTSPFVENMYDQIRDDLNEYEVVIKRWPQYLLNLESVVADIERAIMKALEKQYSDILMPLRDSIPKLLEKQVQKLTRRQSTSVYLVPNQLGTFLNTVKRVLDVLHCRVEGILKSWSSFLTIVGDGNSVFGEQMNGITVMLRKKYKTYLQAIVEKLVSNTIANRSTKLKRILEETKETEGEAEIRERMQGLCLQLADSIRNLHGVFSSRIFVAICRGFWDRMGQILDDLFASQMQTLQGNSLQEKDLDPPRSVIEARSILG